MPSYRLFLNALIGKADENTLMIFLSAFYTEGWMQDPI